MTLPASSSSRSADAFNVTANAFSSVKLPADLVRQAKEAAGPMRRSTAGQIEYWATLGRIAEHSGLTVQESREAIERYEAAARQAQHDSVVANLTGKLLAQDEPLDESLDAIERRFALADETGGLADRVRQIVTGNRANAMHTRQAA